jgi:tripartite ATP-independent transporter DctM subunit
MQTALIGFAAMLILVLVLRLPIAFAMGVVGFVGFAFATSFPASLALLGQIVADTSQDYGLSVLPLFILMGNFVSRAGLSQELYTASYAFLGHRRGGLAMATIVACGGFAAICGSSLATAATMSKVAMPSMRKYGYSDSLATASIASGGTLGILIPPSVIMVIYGFLTETSIRDLFAAGFLPGFLGVLLYMLAVKFTVIRRPQDGPAVARMPWPARWRALGGVWGTVVLFIVVIGGIYGGVFTPTEAAGIGAGGAFLMALLRGRLTVMSTLAILGETARTTAVLFAILMGALMFSNFMTRTGLPEALQGFIGGLHVAPIVIILLILMIYIILGCILESLSMLLLTIPVFFPVVHHLGYDPIWFGILAVVITEISLITPPVGLNVFVLASVLPDVKTSTIFRGIMPFFAADMVRLTLLVFVPAISLFLPHLLYGTG